MKITIFWTWYVWLVTGTCLAEVWHEVMCIDIDENKVENLKNGIIPIYEPGLEELVKRNYKEKRLDFSTNSKAWVEFGEVIFSAVGTPPDENHKADLRFVREVAKTFAKNLNWYKVFVNKSTVPVGTGEMCKNIIEEELLNRWVKIDFDIVSNPEFLKEWVAVRDFMLPDRIVCGLESDKAKSIMEKVYKPFTRTERPLFFTDIKSAEIIKYAANSFLATKISFINEIANFAEKVGGNVSDISKWIGLDERIWSRFLHAWIGYGWSCFPKDVQALIETWKEYDFEFKIIKATEEVNKNQKTIVIDKLLKYIPDLKWKTISIWWLAFKPKTDDTRDAPSLSVIDKLLEIWVKEIRAFDPVARENIKRIYQDKIVFSTNNYGALENADALIILTEWDEFRIVDLDRIAKLMNQKIVIDWRNIWNKNELKEAWFIYEWIWK